MIKRPPQKPIKDLFQPEFDTPSIYSLSKDDLTDLMSGWGEDDYRGSQVFEWLYGHRVDDFDEMKNLPKALREKLNEHFSIEPLETLVKQESQDGTMKFLFKLRDGYTIETVLMRHDYGNSVCVTTQVGCRLGCTFCASTLGNDPLEAVRVACGETPALFQLYTSRNDDVVASIVQERHRLTVEDIRNICQE